MKNITPILFYLFLPLILLISILPFGVHYAFSFVLYVIGYRLLGYRKEVVKSNLLIAFPEKKEQERLAIEQRFYHFFFDIFVECIKSFTLSKKQLEKKILIDPLLLETVNKYYDDGRNIFVVMPHYGNWEYGNFGAQIYFKHQVNSIYRKLSNTFFDLLFYKLRTRLGSGMFPMKQAYRKMVGYTKGLHATGFIADQSSDRKNATWISFFGREVPFFVGIETMSKKLNTPVIYIYFDRDDKKRTILKGELITDTPQLMEDGYILKSFAEKLEDQIRLKPELWLWTHRRWKRVKT